MKAVETFNVRIAAIHGPGGEGGDVMDVRHEEFMAMADAFLGPGFDRAKLAQVESLQLALQEGQARLCEELDAHRIDGSRYVDEANMLHARIARHCEAILGPADFLRLFGVSPSAVSAHIDKDLFLEQS
jgi:hypothetical protein